MACEARAARGSVEYLFRSFNERIEPRNIYFYCILTAKEDINKKKEQNGKTNRQYKQYKRFKKVKL